MVEENEVPRLLTAEVVAICQHPLKQIPIPYGGSNQRDASLPNSQFETEIAHDGPDDGVSLQVPPCPEIKGKRRYDVVATYDGSLVAYEHRPIGIPVLG